MGYANIEDLRSYRKEYARLNKEKIREYQKTYRPIFLQKHPDYYKKYAGRYNKSPAYSEARKKYMGDNGRTTIGVSMELQFLNTTRCY